MKKFLIFLSVLLFTIPAISQTNWKIGSYMHSAWVAFANEEHRPNDAFSLVDTSAIKFRLSDDYNWEISVLDEDGNVHMKLDSIGDFVLDVTTFFVDASTGYVGVGLIDPDELLELYKVGTQLKLSGGAADYATFAVAADGALTITTVDVDASEGDIVLMPDGNVGIGTTAPDKALEINSATGANLRLTYNDADGSATYYTDFSTTSTGGLSIDAVDETIDFNGNYAVDLQNIPDLAAGAGKTAYWFDGTSDWNIDLGNTIDFKGTSENFSIFMRALRSGSTGADQNLFHYNPQMQIYYKNSDNTIVYYAWGPAVSLPSTSTISTDKWFDVAVTVETDRTGSLYVNGILEDSDDFSGSIVDNTTNMFLGQRAYNSDQPWMGNIGTTYLFNLALTAAEVKALSSGAPIPYKYLGASQTLIVPSDDCDDDDTANWTDVNGALTDNGTEYTYTVTTGAAVATFTDEAALTIGKKYRATVLAKDGTGAGSTVRINALTNGDVVIENGTGITVAAGFAIATVEWTATETNNKVQIEIVAGTVSDGETVLFDEIECNSIGCVGQWEPGGITPLTWNDASENGLDGTVSGAIVTNPLSNLMVDGTMILKEQADADADNAGYGQIWVNTATPNELWWTDDAGTDAQLGNATSLLLADGDFIYYISGAEFRGQQTGDARFTSSTGKVVPSAVDGMVICPLNLQQTYWGLTPVIDQLTVYYNTDANGDDFDFALMRTDLDGSVTEDAGVDDIGNGTSGDGSATMLSGDVTLAAFGYWLECDINNTDANQDVDIYQVTVEYHYE